MLDAVRGGLTAWFCFGAAAASGLAAAVVAKIVDAVAGDVGAGSVTVAATADFGKVG